MLSKKKEQVKMRIFTIDFKDMMKEVFIKGRTTMGCVWLMFLLGFIFGLTILK